ncbi:MAG: NYN domain-containing protein [Actinomycetota bacterium]
MDRCAVFVDAGYLFASGGLLCHNTRKRGDLVLDELQLLEWLCSQAEEHSHVEVLRTYWYDGARSGIPTESQKRIAARPGVKLRLGRVNGAGQQKGVDALIYRDLITLATERAITDAYLLSGDEDLREGVKAAQDRGVRVTLIGIPAPSGYNQSEELCWEVDDQLTLGRDDLSKVLGRTTSPRAESDADPQVSAATAGASFASEWLASSDPQGVVALLEQRPRIPTPLDGELMRSAETMMRVDLREDQASKRQVRRAFWESIEAADLAGYSDSGPGEYLES